MGKRTTRRHSRNSRRKTHRGGSMFDWFKSSDTSNSTNAVYDSSHNVVNSVYDTSKNVGSGFYNSLTNVFSSNKSSTPPTQPAQSPNFSAFGNTGGRRRRRRTKMRGGDFSPNSAFTNAMEVQNIQMASPQTLVGGRRRRRKSSRRSRSSRRR